MSDDPVERIKDLGEEFRALTPQWKCWFRTLLVIFALQIAATGYDFTLPVFQSLYLPFFGCYLLAMIPLHMVSRKRDRVVRGMQDVALEMQLAVIAEQEEAYRLITGEERRR